MKGIPLILLAVSVNCRIVQARASVKVSPDSTQFWEYDEQVSVSCEDFGPKNWTLWRFTKRGGLSECGSGWGSQGTGSACDLKTLKPSDSGLYWCESPYHGSSDTINITVTGGPVILQTPVKIEEGLEVALSCRFKSGFQNNSVDFYRNQALLKSSLEALTRIQFSRDQQGAYSCQSNGHHSPLVHMYLQDDSPAPVLVLNPDSEQIFEYSSMDFSCEPQIEGWAVYRYSPKTASKPWSQCGPDWGSVESGFICKINTIKRLDSTIYWCGNNMRRSNSVQLLVKNRGVILQVPVLPVSAGQTVQMLCLRHTEGALTARFYRDGHIFMGNSTGLMTFQQVAMSDDGLYHCEMGGEKSQPSHLRVKAAAPPPASQKSALSLVHLRYIIVFAPYVASTLLFISIYRQTGGISITHKRHRRQELNLEPEYEDVIPDVTTEYQF
ncbi:unnamed protein product [Knipowitschia caucasica]|uniref:Ig-like domain-containing protein n=1 Tax=Knipowitschia caucasica TaxID=637954 RepID=A0AAV2KPX2_KNICA